MTLQHVVKHNDFKQRLPLQQASYATHILGARMS